MTISERIKKTQNIKTSLLGMEVAMTEFVAARLSTWELKEAINHIQKAQAELAKDIYKITQMSK